MSDAEDWLFASADRGVGRYGKRVTEHELIRRCARHATGVGKTRRISIRGSTEGLPNMEDHPRITDGKQCGTVCLFGSFPVSQEYSHNMCVEQGLRAAGWDVLQCRAADRVGSSGRRDSLRSPIRILTTIACMAFQWLDLIRKHAKLPHYDLMIVAYPSHFDIFLAAVLAGWRRRPVVMDAFIGLYSTIVEDRKLVSPRNPLAWIVRTWEWVAFRLARRVIVDTDVQADKIVNAYGLERRRVFAVPVGIDEELWQPNPLPEGNSPFRVAFWSTFIPLHGAECLVEAAKRLDDAGVDVQIEVIGDGQTAPSFQEALDRLSPGNLVWQRRFVKIEELVQLARRSHCCIGILGATDKADSVIPYKVYQALAAARPVITADTVAARRVLTDRVSALLIPSGDPESLAQAIVQLANDRVLCEQLVSGGRRAYEENLSAHVMMMKLDANLRPLFRSEPRL